MKRNYDIKSVAVMAIQFFYVWVSLKSLNFLLLGCEMAACRVSLSSVQEQHPPSLPRDKRRRRMAQEKKISCSLRVRLER